MTRIFLLRGMLAGIVAGLLVFVCARWLGEPQVERAIAFEQAMDQASGAPPEIEMVSRRVQRTIGLLTGTLVYGTAIGGLFGLVFAVASGRMEITTPQNLSAVLAALGFLSVGLVPALKYPANPPAVGNPDTIGMRTASYFFLVASSVAALVFALQMGKRIALRWRNANRWVFSAILYVAIVAIVFHFLPEIDEVPPSFPATLLWKFRVAALEIQFVLWATIGFLFGFLTGRNVPA
jgi:predicted cobalt transporter CbtA